MNKLRFTEREVIEYTITKGFKGEELETVAWKQRGCLRTDGTYKKLINKLECHFEHVLVEGKGKKKVYVLSSEKEEPTARKDNRKGRNMPRKDENVMLTNYVHTALFQLHQKGALDRTTYKELGKQLFFGDRHRRYLHGSVRAIFKEHLVEKKIPRVWSYTEWYFQSRAREETELAIGELEKQNKIVIEEFLVGNFDIAESNESDKITTYFKKLDSERALEIERAISEIVEANGFSYAEYKKQLALPYHSKKLLETQDEVQQHLKWHFGLNYFYQAIDIKLTDSEPSVVIEYREAQTTFLNKTLGLVKKNKDSLKYRNAKRKSEKFYYLCVLLYVKAMGMPVEETDLTNEIGWINASLAELEASYEEEKPFGFIHTKS